MTRTHFPVSHLFLLLIMATVLLVPTNAHGGVLDDACGPEARLKEPGVELPLPRQPAANYFDGVRTGNLVFLAGKGPMRADGTGITGKPGADPGIEEGYEGARLTAISQLAVLEEMPGDLRRVKRIVRVFGMVNSDPDFVEQPAEINGFSDLIVAVSGERGRHARAVVGVASLPRDQAVEIEMVVEVEDREPALSPGL